MKKQLLMAAAALALAVPAIAQDAEPEGAPSPNQIVDAAPADEWISIPAEDLLVMTLAPDRDGNPRQVIIQLMPAPFSQGWVENIRTFARAKWYDNITVNRVQDNYVVQWGDPNYDNPEAEGEAKALPEGLHVMGESEYLIGELSVYSADYPRTEASDIVISTDHSGDYEWIPMSSTRVRGSSLGLYGRDSYAGQVAFHSGWPLALELTGEPSDPESLGTGEKVNWWPIHCYGMVGVGRGYSPDTGSGAELYTVIGQAPRHLDRNIALVGRIVEGIEHLSSLPRGSGALGFYTEEEFGKRAPILSVRVASDLAEAERPNFEYLATNQMAFAKYTDARANRRDPFFIAPAGGADICNIPVPVRRVSAEVE